MSKDGKKRKEHTLLALTVQKGRNGPAIDLGKLFIPPTESFVCQALWVGGVGGMRRGLSCRVGMGDFSCQDTLSSHRWLSPQRVTTQVLQRTGNRLLLGTRRVTFHLASERSAELSQANVEAPRCQGPQRAAAQE